MYIHERPQELFRGANILRVNSFNESEKTKDKSAKLKSVYIYYS